MVEIIYLILVIFSLVQVILALKEFGASSLGKVFGHFLTVIVLLAGIRLLFFLVDSHILLIEDATLMFIWHLMFYESIGVMILVNRSLISLLGQAKLINPWALGSVSLMVMALLFLLAKPLDPWVTQHIAGTWWMRSGIFHFVAMLFAGVAAWGLYQIKQKFASSVGRIVWPLLIAISILSVVHLWELLTESWMLIRVTDEFGEFVERYLWIAVYFFVAYAFWAVRRAARANGPV